MAFRRKKNSETAVEPEFPLGDMLRGERATKAKSLNDVQNELRIKAEFIDAIENLDPSVFETPGFVSGYVRSYARYLGLDGDEVFQRFCEEANFDPPVRLEGTSTRNKTRKNGLAGAAFAGHSNLEREKWWERVSVATLASLAVLVFIVAGLGYGGYRVMQEVQRVTIAPIPVAPEIADAGPALQLDSGSENAQSSLSPAMTDDEVVAELYRPQLLDVPVLVPRDGPISLIQPELSDIEVADGVLAASIDEAAAIPQITEQVATGVEIFAAQPAWISVYSPSQGTIFEQILDTNTRYRVPFDVTDALLRAGNSGSVYLIVDGAVFGPVGQNTSVAKNVALDAGLIAERFPNSETLAGYDPTATPVNLAQSQ